MATHVEALAQPSKVMQLSQLSFIAQAKKENKCVPRWELEHNITAVSRIIGFQATTNMIDNIAPYREISVNAILAIARKRDDKTSRENWARVA